MEEREEGRKGGKEGEREERRREGKRKEGKRKKGATGLKSRKGLFKETYCRRFLPNKFSNHTHQKIYTIHTHTHKYTNIRTKFGFLLKSH